MRDFFRYKFFMLFIVIVFSFVLLPTYSVFSMEEEFSVPPDTEGVVGGEENTVPVDEEQNEEQKKLEAAKAKKEKEAKALAEKKKQEEEKKKAELAAKAKKEKEAKALEKKKQEELKKKQEEEKKKKEKILAEKKKQEEKNKQTTKKEKGEKKGESSEATKLKEMLFEWTFPNDFKKIESIKLDGTEEEISLKVCCFGVDNEGVLWVIDNNGNIYKKEAGNKWFGFESPKDENENPLLVRKIAVGLGDNTVVVIAGNLPARAFILEDGKWVALGQKSVVGQEIACWDKNNIAMSTWGGPDGKTVFKFNQESQEWDNIPAHIGNLTINDKMILGAGGDYKTIWKYDSSTKKWELKGGALKYVYLLGDILIGVSWDGEIFIFDANKFPDEKERFTMGKRGAQFVTANLKGAFYVVDTENFLYERKSEEIKKEVKISWKPLEASIIKKLKYPEDFTQEDIGLLTISVAPDGTIWGTDNKNDVWCKKVGGSWEKFELKDENGNAIAACRAAPAPDGKRVAFLTKPYPSGLAEPCVWEDGKLTVLQPNGPWLMRIGWGGKYLFGSVWVVIRTVFSYDFNNNKWQDTNAHIGELTISPDGKRILGLGGVPYPIYEYVKSKKEWVYKGGDNFSSIYLIDSKYLLAIQNGELKLFDMDRFPSDKGITLGKELSFVAVNGPTIAVINNKGTDGGNEVYSYTLKTETEQDIKSGKKTDKQASADFVKKLVENMSKIDASKFVKEDLALTQICFDGKGNLWGINDNGEIYTRTVKSKELVKIDPPKDADGVDVSAKYISVGDDGTVAILGGNTEPFIPYSRKAGTDKWVELGAQGSVLMRITCGAKGAIIGSTWPTGVFYLDRGSYLLKRDNKFEKVNGNIADWAVASKADGSALRPFYGVDNASKIYSKEIRKSDIAIFNAKGIVNENIHYLSVVFTDDNSKIFFTIDNNSVLKSFIVDSSGKAQYFKFNKKTDVNVLRDNVSYVDAFIMENKLNIWIVDNDKQVYSLSVKL